MHKIRQKGSGYNPPICRPVSADAISAEFGPECVLCNQTELHDDRLKAGGKFCGELGIEFPLFRYVEA